MVDPKCYRAWDPACCAPAISPSHFLDPSGDRTLVGSAAAHGANDRGLDGFSTHFSVVSVARLCVTLAVVLFSRTFSG